MLGYQRRLQVAHQPRRALQVFGIQAFGAAEREAHPMQRERIAIAQIEQTLSRSAATEVILGMHFEPPDRRTRLVDFAMMWKAQPDTCARSAAGDLGTGARRDQNERLRIARGRGLTGAGVRTRGAVILTGSIDAVA